MSGLQGESSLSDSEKSSEALRLIELLIDETARMSPTERRFVEDMYEMFENDDFPNVSNKQLFWLRDLNTKY